MSKRRIFAWTDCTDCKLAWTDLAWTDLQSVHKIEKICYLDGFAIRPQRNRKDMLSHFKC